jgi:hypothetical protein
MDVAVSTNWLSSEFVHCNTHEPENQTLPGRFRTTGAKPMAAWPQL